MAPNTTKQSPLDLLSTLNSKYGQATYSLVVLLIIWTQVLNPIYLDAKSDTKALASIAETLNQAAQTLQETARTLATTAEELKHPSPSPR